MKVGKNILNWIKTMDIIKTDKITLRKFALTMSFLFAAITLFIFIKHRQLASSIFIVSLLFLLTGLSRPVLLKYFYILWMKLAFILGWFNTRLLLCIIFYLVFSPIALIMRILKVDFLERKLHPQATSYWKIKNKQESLAENYNKQF